MKPKRILLLVLAVFFGALLYYFYGGSSVPEGQRELVRINGGNFAELRQEFNAAQDRVRVIAMLSPT